MVHSFALADITITGNVTRLILNGVRLRILCFIFSLVIFHSLFKDESLAEISHSFLHSSFRISASSIIILSVELSPVIVSLL